MGAPKEEYRIHLFLLQTNETKDSHLYAKGNT